MESLTLDVDAPVSLVVHQSWSGPEDQAADWFERLVAVAAEQPGYVSSDVAAPSPSSPDWVLIQRFESDGAARAWLAADARARLYAALGEPAPASDRVRVFREVGDEDAAVSVVLSSTVRAQDEAAFLDWQRQVARAEARFRGFRGHRVQPPVPGVQQRWVVIVSFDTREDLGTWVDSPERAELLAQGKRFNEDLVAQERPYGFGFWKVEDDTFRLSVWKNNLLVLLVLYPIVYLWADFISGPLFDDHGIPVWLAMFVGNFVSTQLTGWIFVPWVFRRFSWWLKPGLAWRRDALGYGALAVLYGASMALYAWFLAMWG